MREYSRALEERAAARPCRFVSMADLLVTSDLADNGVHLNDAGYSKLAARIAAELHPEAGSTGRS